MFNVAAFVEWAQGIGLRLGEICKLFEIEPPQEELPPAAEPEEEKSVCRRFDPGLGHQNLS